MFRCFGNKNKVFGDYHDVEWGKPIYDDQVLFEMLILEGAHAGLSWEIILMKRDAYREAFHFFDPIKVSEMSDEELEKNMENKGIVRNRLKIFSARKNAIAFLKIVEEYKSFSNYIWGFVNNKPINNAWKEYSEVPSVSEEGDLLSKDLKKRGMTFVGPRIIYAYMQSIGMVNDHLTKCFRYDQVIKMQNDAEKS
ncbi:DNA-3-methyladenine glycosylase I [Candidatus Nesciobacter abundans]|uniref:DNA-3-methyladenine glycosylase I n=2 Tax=Candidatus Nesciobacter abundans TaxID=2601668 RepID=A0A5C0UHU1_9PROT|nr:DNA-3-methyladenine glycosylase I [Candidatus Nesciobacter abundans]